MAPILALMALLLPIPAVNGAKIVLMGDSIMAEGTPGWGHFFRSHVNLPVVNLARGGASARSYTRDGDFSSAISILQAGDSAVMGFGMNDGGGIHNLDNGRADCPGSQNEVCNTPSEKGILTYYAYIQRAAAEIHRKGATLVICGPIPRNPWSTGQFGFTPSRFTSDARAVADSFGDPTAVTFVDHGLFVANAFHALGASTVNGFYDRPHDNTHPNANGMQVVTNAFVEALESSQSQLKNHLTRPS